MSAILGAIILMMADIVARSLTRVVDLPVGAVMALLGVPLPDLPAQAKGTIGMIDTEKVQTQANGQVQAQPQPDAYALLSRDLRVGYGEHIVIEQLSISILKSDVTALVGPNGSGKSTLLEDAGAPAQAERGCGLP